MNVKCLILIFIVFVVFITIYLVSRKKEKYSRYSTGWCSPGKPNCPGGSYSGSCGAFFNISDWGDNFYSGSCGQVTCKRYGVIPSKGKTCVEREETSKPIFGYLPSDFFNNLGAYSFDNIDGQLVLK